MLKIVRIALVVLFCLALLGAGGLYYYNFTHEDTSPPTFRSEGDLIEISVSDPQPALLRGLAAYDNMDGDITDRIMIKEISPFINDTDVSVTYIVFDDASNYALCTRTARYTDYESPRFRITKPLIYSNNETVAFKDRVSATDLIDGNISGRITLVESTVSNAIPGTYSATLSVSNHLGDVVYLPLTIQIVNRTVSMPTVTLSTYLVYLDQGSTANFRRYLEAVTDPLSEEEVPLRRVRVNDDGVDLSTPGVYEVYYYYTGLSGELVTSILTVVVE